MKDIFLKEFKLIVDVNSARKEEIDDNTYFGESYKHYISNSSMKNINPNEEGSPSKYQNPPKLSTSSLVLGTVVHSQVLTPGEFEFAPKCFKPTAKLGNTIDKIKFYRSKGESIYNSIEKACTDCDYYRSSFKTKIPKIIKEGFKYYWITRKYDNNVLTLPDKDWDSANACISNIERDCYIQKLLHPTDKWGDKIPSYNEDALFIDVVITYKDRAVTLPIKMKADNWTIDEESRILTLNDLKTSIKPTAWFMNEEYGSFYKYHYYRQFALYMMILKSYCMKKYGVTDAWTFKGNVLVVNTTDYNTKVCKVTEEHLKLGTEEYERLLKMIAYYEMFGYDEEVNFI